MLLHAAVLPVNCSDGHAVKLFTCYSASADIKRLDRELDTVLNEEL